MARKYDRILVLARPSIGDVLLATPLIRALHERWPDAPLDTLIYAGQEQVLEGNPDVQSVITTPKHPTTREHVAQLRQMGRRYDLGVSVSTSDRALLSLLAFARDRYSVVPAPDERGGRRDAWKSWICRSTLVADPNARHTLETNHRLGLLAGVSPGYEVRLPRRPESHQLLERLLPGIWTRSPYAVLHLTPGLPYKRWRLAGWAALARYLGDQKFDLVLTGAAGAEERAYLDEAVRLLPDGVHDVAGKLRLADLTVLLEHCALYVGPDTLATHMAAAVGAPTVAIFGPTNPLVWAPWPRGYKGPVPPFRRTGTQRTGNVMLVQGPGGCVPCQQQGCERHRTSRSDCLDQLDPVHVIAAAAAVLDAYGTNAAFQTSST